MLNLAFILPFDAAAPHVTPSEPKCKIGKDLHAYRVLKTQ